MPSRCALAIPAAALDLIRAAEGLRLRAYRDAVGVWAIGYGHTGTVYGGAIGRGMAITRETAERLVTRRARERALFDTPGGTPGDPVAGKMPAVQKAS